MTVPTKTKPLALSTRVNRMYDEHLECRDYGHAWRDERIGQTENPEVKATRTALCVRCSTERIEHIGVDGDIVYRRYEYADSYQLTGYGRDTLKRGQYRLERVKRWRKSSR